MNNQTITFRINNKMTCTSNSVENVIHAFLIKCVDTKILEESESIILCENRHSLYFDRVNSRVTRISFKRDENTINILNKLNRVLN